MLKSLKRFFVWWDKATFGTLWFTSRKGCPVGADREGNRYYKTEDDSKRWVVYANTVEASSVPPGWYGWLHRTRAILPDSNVVLSFTEDANGRFNSTGTLLAYQPLGSLAKRNGEESLGYVPWVPSEHDKE